MQEQERGSSRPAELDWSDCWRPALREQRGKIEPETRNNRNQTPGWAASCEDLRQALPGRRSPLQRCCCFSRTNTWRTENQERTAREQWVDWKAAELLEAWLLTYKARLPLVQETCTLIGLVDNQETNSKNRKRGGSEKSTDLTQIFTKRS